MHFFPRYVGDPFEGRAIEPSRITAPVYAEGESAAMSERMVQELGASIGAFG